MHSAAQHERGASAGLRPAPAEAFKPRKQQQQRRATELGGAVWAGRTRRRPIHGGSMAPSMAPTVLSGHPITLPTVSCARGMRAGIQDQKKKAESEAVPTKVGIYQRQIVRVKAAALAGTCPEAEGMAVQDRWRHGWRHRAPMGEGALLAKHCFASARTHSRQRLGRTPEGGSRRVLPTHTAPAQPTETQPLWLLLWLWLLPAAGGPPRVSAAPPHPTRSGSSRRYRQCRSSRSGSWPGTAGDSPRRSSTSVPDTRSRW